MAHGAQASTVRLGGVPSGCEGSCNGQGRKGSTESDRGRSAREGKPPLGRWEVLYATANQPLLVMMESKLQPGTIFRRDFIKTIVEVTLKC